jgi:hypothetical protein
MWPRSYSRLVSFFAVSVGLEGQTPTIPELVAKAKLAVVQVIASDTNWAPIKTGTGFFTTEE